MDSPTIGELVAARDVLQSENQKAVAAYLRNEIVRRHKATVLANLMQDLRCSNVDAQTYLRASLTKPTGEDTE